MLCRVGNRAESGFVLPICPIAWVIDLTHITKAPATQRRALAGHLKRFEAFSARWNAGSALVVPNAWLRGLATAVFWVSPPKFPTELFSEPLEAERWARNSDSRNGVRLKDEFNARSVAGVNGGEGIMKNQQLLTWSVVGLFVALALVAACSSDSGNGGSQGTFNDGPVEGLGYEVDGQSGTTGPGGEFDYRSSSDQITFSVGDIVLGTATVKSFMTPVDLVADAVDETNNTVTNIARFLQTLDGDANLSNGIQIPAEATEAAAGRSMNFAQTPEAFEGGPRRAHNEPVGFRGRCSEGASKHDPGTAGRQLRRQLLG